MASVEAERDRILQALYVEGPSMTTDCPGEPLYGRSPYDVVPVSQKRRNGLTGLSHGSRFTPHLASFTNYKVEQRIKYIYCGVPLGSQQRVLLFCSSNQAYSLYRSYMNIQCCQLSIPLLFRLRSHGRLHTIRFWNISGQ